MKRTKITRPQQDKWEPEDIQHKTQIDHTLHYKNHNIPTTGRVGTRENTRKKIIRRALEPIHDKQHTRVLERKRNTLNSQPFRRLRTNPKHKGGYIAYKNKIRRSIFHITTNKKGFIRTLEGAVSLIILLTFIFYVIPHIPNEQKISAQTKNYIMLNIENLDKNGTLDTHLLGSTPNLQAIKNALNKTISSNINYTIGTTSSNSTGGTIFSEESYAGANITYSANNTYLKDAYIVLTFINATNPRININTQQIYTYTGTHSQEPLKLDLTPHTTEGTNTIEIKTQNNSTIKYTLIINNKELLSPIPGDKPISVVTYILSGKENKFQPTVLEIYLWR